MSVLDWLVLGVLGASLALGAWRGLVYEIMSVLGWVAAFVAAQWFAPQVAPMLPLSGAAEPLRYAAAFVVVFVGAAFAGGLLAWGVKKLVEAFGLRPVDRTLGAAFGLLRGVVILLGVAVVVGMTPLKNAAWWQGSGSGPILSAVLKGLKPVLPADFGRYLPD